MKPALRSDQRPAQNFDVVWKYIAGSSQEHALTAPCDEILYCGSRGPGKTDVQIMRFRSRVGKGYGQFWRGVIIDREYKQLDDLVAKTKRWFPRFRDGARFVASKADYKWVWPTGEELLFRAAFDADDYWNFHGQELTFIGWNELTKYPNPDLYDALTSCNRSSFTPEKDSPSKPIIAASGEVLCDRNKGVLLPRIPLEIFSTTNPYGIGHNWVKQRWITGRRYGEVQRATREVFNPATQRRETVTRTSVALFGSYRENPYLDPLYVASLEAEKNPNRRKAWLLGDWDVESGGIFDDLWQNGLHVLPRFIIPAGWKLDRGFDWGSSTPFSVIWFAEANGEECVLPDGTRWSPRAGTLIQFFEWYGTDALGTNRGLKLTPKVIAEKIALIEKQLLDAGWIRSNVRAGPADNQIFANPRMDVKSYAQVMEDAAKITWEQSDKSAGSRRRGVELMRNRLYNAAEGEGPGAYVMQHCRATLHFLPGLPRDPKDPEDVDTKAEDHVWDVWRYRVLKGAPSYVADIATQYRG